MTAAAFLDALRCALAADLADDDWRVVTADDDWTALTHLTNATPHQFRLVITIADLEPIGTEDTGLVCNQLVRCIVQTKRGMTEDATAVAEYALLDATEHVRRLMMAIVFQPPGAAPYSTADLAAGRQPHPTLGQFTHAGERPYQSPIEEVMLEHPAREISFRNLIALSTPDQLRPVYLPI